MIMNKKESGHTWLALSNEVEEYNFNHYLLLTYSLFLYLNAYVGVQKI